MSRTSLLLMISRPDRAALPRPGGGGAGTRLDAVLVYKAYSSRGKPQCCLGGESMPSYRKHLTRSGTTNTARLKAGAR